MNLSLYALLRISTGFHPLNKLRIIQNEGHIPAQRKRTCCFAHTHKSYSKSQTRNLLLGRRARPTEHAHRGSHVAIITGRRRNGNILLFTSGEDHGNEGRSQDCRRDIIAGMIEAYVEILCLAVPMAAAFTTPSNCLKDVKVPIV